LFVIARIEGVGLGLAITKALIELHQGWIEVTSAMDRGTTVTLHFPPHRAIKAKAGAVA